jgi:hypothetical protein
METKQSFGSLVFLVLISAFAVLLVYRVFRRLRTTPRYPIQSGIQIEKRGLFVSLAVTLAVPMQKLFFESWGLRALIATMALCTPVFFAGIIFISSFARVGFRGSALGSNLFGSLLGGLLESSSLWFGLKSLTILAALLYLGSAIFLRGASEVEESDATVPSLASQEQH